MTAFLTDTDIIIDIQRGFPAALVWFASLTEPPGISVYSVMELIQDAQNKDHIDKAQRIVTRLTIIYATEADQRKALDDYKQFHLSHSLGLLDALIAASAIGLGVPLATFNVKHFRAVPGLTTVQPYKR